MFDAYKVAVKLTLVNGVSGALGALTSQFSMFNKHVNNTQGSLTELELKLKNIKTLGLVGGGMFAAGAIGLSLFKGPLEEAIKFDQQVNKFKLFGMGDKVNGEAVKFAKGMNIMGSSYTENMKLMTEAQGVFRESGISGSAALDGAKLAAPYLAKIAFATKSLDGESAAKLTTSAMAMLRYVEDSGGLKSPEKFKALADAGWKMVQTSGGSVSWEQLRQFKARAGVSGMNLSGDAMAEMEPLITMIKGSTAGFSLRTAYNRLNGIVKVPNQVAHELVKSGVWDGSKISWNSQGGIKSYDGNPLKNSDLFSSNPIEFYEKYIMPMHKAKGITSDAAIGQSNAMVFGSTGGAMFTLIDKNLGKLKQSLDAQNKALGVDSSYKVAGESATGKIVALHAEWEKTLTELGTTVLPIAIRAVTGLTTVLKGVINFAHDFPTLTKGLVVGFGAISALFLVGGVFFLATAAFGALGIALSPIVGGIVALSAALAGLAWIFGSDSHKGQAGHYVSTGKGMAWVADSVKTSAQSRNGVGQPVNLYMDGKKVGEGIYPHFAKEVNKPQHGSGKFDPTMNVMPTNMRLSR